MYHCTSISYLIGCTVADKHTCCHECEKKSTCEHPCLFKPDNCILALKRVAEEPKESNMVKSDESEESLMMCGRDFESRPAGAYVEEPEATKSVIDPCPFCGNKSAVYTDNEIDQVTEGEDGFNVDPCYAVICPMSEGGCGASGGYRPTEEMAIEAWNRRADT